MHLAAIGAALLMSSSVGHAASAPCPTQALTVVNQAHVRQVALSRVETAVEAQSVQLRARWQTPCVRFGSGGWRVYLQAPVVHNQDGSTSVPIRGWHYGSAPLYHGPLWSGSPYAVVDTGAASYQAWAYALSHEVLEMLADPNDDVLVNPLELREVCDPVQRDTYSLDGVKVSDFVFPSYLDQGRGPYDEMGVLGEPQTPGSGVLG